MAALVEEKEKEKEKEQQGEAEGAAAPVVAVRQGEEGRRKGAGESFCFRCRRRGHTTKECLRPRRGGRAGRGGGGGGGTPVAGAGPALPADPGMDQREGEAGEEKEQLGARKRRPSRRNASRMRAPAPTEEGAAADGTTDAIAGVPAAAAADAATTEKPAEEASGKTEEGTHTAGDGTAPHARARKRRPPRNRKRGAAAAAAAAAAPAVAAAAAAPSPGSAADGGKDGQESRAQNPRRGQRRGRHLSESAAATAAAAARPDDGPPGARLGVRDLSVYSIDVECIASGKTHLSTDRYPGSVVLVNCEARPLLSLKVKPTCPVVSTLTPLSGVREEDIRNGIPLEDASARIKEALPADAVLVGQSPQSDIVWLGLAEGVDFARAIDLGRLFAAQDPRRNRPIIHPLRHEVRIVLGVENVSFERSAETDAVWSVKLFRAYHAASDEQIVEWKRKLLATPPHPSTAKQLNFQCDGVCLSSGFNRNTCTCGEG